MRLRLVLLLVCLNPAFASAGGEALEKAKRAFAKSDKVLNDMRERAKSSLSKRELLRLQKEQRSWVELRDWLAKGNSMEAGDGEESSLESWKASTWMTDQRAKYIAGLVHPDKISKKTWEGEWYDGRQSHLWIVENQDGTFWFNMSVQSGHHIGELGGLAKSNFSQARFTTKSEASGGESWLSFERQGSRIVVSEDNTHGFHGAGVSFGGSYVRIATASPRRKVVASSKLAAGASASISLLSRVSKPGTTAPPPATPGSQGCGCL